MFKSHLRMTVRLKRLGLPSVLLLLIAPVLLDCSAIRLESPGERLFIAGNLARAAEAFEQSLAGAPSPREHEMSLYYLTLIYATPGATYDRMRSRVMLDQLLGSFPRTQYRSHVLGLRLLEDEVAKLESAIRAAREEIAQWSRATTGCRTRVAELDDEVGVLFQMGDEERESRRACELALASFRRRVDEREAEITRLQDAVSALEALKRIDTERKPGS